MDAKTQASVWYTVMSKLTREAQNQADGGSRELAKTFQGAASIAAMVAEAYNAHAPKDATNG